MRRASLIGTATVAATSVVLAVAAVTVRHRGRLVVTRDRSQVPVSPVVIVPGARVFPDGRISLTLRGRLDAAFELYQSRRVAHLLVSGANDLPPDLDESAVMSNYLVERGVPESAITGDEAGVNTWATCRRARQVYGVNKAVFVTEHPYANRAGALCRAAGLDAVVLSINTPRLRPLTRLRVLGREALANVKACAVILSSRAARRRWGSETAEQ